MAVRKIQFYDSVADFLEELISHNNARITILIVCSTRNHFLEQLFGAMQATTSQADKPPREQDSPQQTSIETPTSGTHRLLTKTIGLLAESSRIKLVFCPTLESLRAYLSVLRVTRASEVAPAGCLTEQRDRRPVLAVLDLIALHCLTLEFSAQGLSRTLANAVEAASREGADLLLCECADSVNGERGQRLWHQDVPLLNASVRTGVDESTSRGRSVPVRRVVQRWFSLDETSRPSRA